VDGPCLPESTPEMLVAMCSPPSPLLPRVTILGPILYDRAVSSGSASIRLPIPFVSTVSICAHRYSSSTSYTLLSFFLTPLGRVFWFLVFWGGQAPLEFELRASHLPLH
jgi:hypothetical protein